MAFEKQVSHDKITRRKFVFSLNDPLELLAETVIERFQKPFELL